MKEGRKIKIFDSLFVISKIRQSRGYYWFWLYGKRNLTRDLMLKKKNCKQRITIIDLIMYIEIGKMAYDHSSNR